MAESMVDLENQLLALNKGNMMVGEYTNAFIDKMELALCMVLNELNKIYRYAKRLPWEYTVPVKHEPNFQAVV